MSAAPTTDLIAALAALGLDRPGRRIGQQLTAVSMTGTTGETHLYTSDGPTGLILPPLVTGDVLRVAAKVACTGSANARTIQLKMGGAQMAYVSVAQSYQTGLDIEWRLVRASDKWVGAAYASPGVGSTGSILTRSDVSDGQTLALTGQLASAADTLTLMAITVSLEPGR